jgi:hypothetical protein
MERLRLNLDELEYFSLWLAEQYKQPTIEAALDKWGAEEPAIMRQMVVEFERTRQPVQLLLPRSQ